MLRNINYKGYYIGLLEDLNFTIKPRQAIVRTPDYTLVIFQSRKCRIMGCKQPIYDIPWVLIDEIQSITVQYDLNRRIDLYKLSRNIQCTFEPELFPALRLTQFNPLCVNVFSTGKIMILGLKSIDFQNEVEDIVSFILINI